MPSMTLQVFQACRNPEERRNSGLGKKRKVGERERRETASPLIDTFKVEEIEKRYREMVLWSRLGEVRAVL